MSSPVRACVSTEQVQAWTCKVLSVFIGSNRCQFVGLQHIRYAPHVNVYTQHAYAQE